MTRKLGDFSLRFWDIRGHGPEMEKKGHDLSFQVFIFWYGMLNVFRI